MIKTGGANVAPPEVEAVLPGVPRRRRGLCVRGARPERGEAVIALVVPVPGASVEPADLQARVRTELSAYKVPRRITVVGHDGRATAGHGEARQADDAGLMGGSR